MKLWTWKRENLPSLSHAFRTAVAATISILLGRLVGLPEAYWAAIATVVVMQSPLGDTVPLAIERIVASALGASIGAIESTYFGANLLVFALAMLLLGLISFALRVRKRHGLLRRIALPKSHWEFSWRSGSWPSGGESGDSSVRRPLSKSRCQRHVCGAADACKFIRFTAAASKV